MAHKVETMAYAGATPWHGLGTKVPEGISTDEMLRRAGLDWGVRLAPVEYGERVFKGRNVLYRTDTGAPLDIVGSRWEPVQNEEVFDFFREYVEAGEATLETAGSLDGGKMVWALAKLDAGFSLGDDRVDGYVLLANPHQYGKSLTVKSTLVRVVCWNTITQALNGQGRAVKLWHNRKFDAGVRQEAKERLGIARDRVDAFAGIADRLSRLTLDDEDVTRIANELLPNQGAAPTDPLDVQSPTVQRIVALYKGEGRGSSLPAARDTGWGLLNAFTEYRDHEYGRSRNNRLSNSWFGTGERLKRRVVEALLPMAPK